MRDDVKKLLAELITLHKDKLGLIKRLLLNEAELRHHISAGNAEGLYLIIERDSMIINDIDVTDFNIAETVSAICGITDTSPDGFDAFLVNLGSGPPAELAGIRKEIRDRLSLLGEERNASVKSMKELTGSLGRDLDDIAVMLRMDIKT